MRADLGRIGEAVTVFHRVPAKDNGSKSDLWRASPYAGCQWHGPRTASTGSDGDVSAATEAVVHVPYEGIEVDTGDIVCRGAVVLTEPATREELLAMLPDGWLTVRSVKRLHCPALSGLTGIARFASETVLGAS